MGADRLTFAERLARLLDDRGWSQAELAKRLQVPATTVNSWARGRALPGARQAWWLAEELDVGFRYLLCGTNFRRR